MACEASSVLGVRMRPALPRLFHFYSPAQTALQNQGWRSHCGQLLCWDDLKCNQSSFSLGRKIFKLFSCIVVIPLVCCIYSRVINPDSTRSVFSAGSNAQVNPQKSVKRTSFVY